MAGKQEPLRVDTTLLYVLLLERVKGYFLQLGAGFCLAGLLKSRPEGLSQNVKYPQ